MKALLAVFALTLSSYAAVAASDLGLLANYYQDCPASHGPHAAYLQSVIRRALRGDEAAMRLLIMHKGIFSTGDNEGFSEVPEALLRTVGDVRYAAFVGSQSAESGMQRWVYFLRTCNISGAGTRELRICITRGSQVSVARLTKRSSQLLAVVLRKLRVER